MGALFGGGSDDSAQRERQRQIEIQKLIAQKQQQAALASRNRQAAYSGSLIGAQSSNYGEIYNQYKKAYNLLGGSDNTNNKIG